MKKLLIYRGDRYSESAFALRDALRTAGVNVRINRKDSEPRTRRSIINWGTRNVYTVNALNKPMGVAKAVAKELTFLHLQQADIPVPFFTNDKAQARQALAEEEIVLARTTTTGHSGQGIVVMRKPDELVDAPLYVQYVPKVAEYRVHVFKDSAIFIQQKRKKEGVEQTADQKLIRSYHNGYVFAENSVDFASLEVKSALYNLSIRAVKALGLDFGAVDAIVGKDGKVYVLEVNTAPALVSTQLKAAYVSAIKEHYSEAVLRGS